MAIVSDIEVRLFANIARLQQDMSAARRTVETATAGMTRSVEQFRNVLAGLGVGIGLKDLAGQIIDAQREFDKLNSALITATGSSVKADKAFAALQRFAATTPFDLKQTTDAFLKLRNMGLDPSERALRSYGNTAGALGKSLNQMVEAVADATTGEFERLKEFGIKAAQMGSSVALTFQGSTTSIGNNAKAIQEYLLKLGETKFAGGMELQAKTLDGAISNLGDSWQALLRTISQSGFGEGVHKGVLALSDALGSLADQIKNGGPVPEGLKLVAKLTAAYLALFVGAPALIGATAGALATLGLNLSLIKLELRAGMSLWALFNTTLTGTSVSAQLAAGAMTKLQLSVSLLFAAFAGWQIGKYLDEQFTQARVAGEVFAGAILTGWENIKYGAQLAWAAIKFGFNEAIGGMQGLFSSFLGATATGLAKIGATAKAAGLQQYADELRAAADAQGTFARETSLLTAAHEKTIELINKETDARVNAAVIAANISEADRQQTGNALQGIESKASATKEALEWYKKTMEASKDAYDQLALETIANRELTSEEKKRIDVMNDLERAGKTLNAQQKKDIKDYQDAIVILARYNDQRKKEQEARSARIADARKDVLGAEQQTQSLRDQVTYYGMAETAVLKLRAAELQRAIDKAAADEIEMGRLQGLLDETQEQITLQSKLTKMKADTSFWTSMEDAAHQTFLSIADGNKNMWERMKESAKNLFFEWLYQMTVKKWIINIGASISGTAGVSGIAGAAETLAGGTPSAGGLSSMASIYSMAKGAYTAITTGFEGISTAVADGVQSALYATGQSSSLLSNGPFAQAAGQLGTTIAGAAIGKFIGSKLAGEYQIGSHGSAITNIATVAGAFFGGPIGAAIGGALGGLANRLFGHSAAQVQNQGLSGTVSASSIEASKYANMLEKGGLFRGDNQFKAVTELDKETKDSFNDTLAAMVATVKGFGSAMGLQVDRIDSYSKGFDLTLTGDAEKDKAAIASLFEGIGNDISLVLVPSLQSFQKEGEALSATLQRVATDYAGIDVILASVGKTFGMVGESSITARENLIAAAGGLDALASGVSYFQQNFLTDAQRLAPIQKQVAEQLAAMGQSGLQTTEQFAAATLAIDVTTEAGAKLFAQMLALAPAFKTVTDATAAAAKAAADLAAQQAAATAAAAAAKAQLLADNETALKGGINTALDAVQAAVAARKKDLQASFESLMQSLSDSIDKWTTKISDLRSLSQLLAGAKVGAAQTATGRASAQAQLEGALAIAKASGVLPSADSIRDAISTVTQMSADQFGSMLDFQREQARAQRSITGLSSITDNQLSTAELTLKAIQDQKAAAQSAYDKQINSLDGLLLAAEKQAQIALGTYQATLSVNASIATLSAAIMALKQGPTTSNPTGTGMSVTDLFGAVLGRSPMAEGLKFWTDQFGTSVDASEYAKFIQVAQPELNAKAGGTWQQWLAEHGAGSTPVQTQATDSLAAAVESLTTQMGDMKTAMQRTANSTAQLADQFNNVSAGGNSLLTESV